MIEKKIIRKTEKALADNGYYATEYLVEGI